MKIKVLGKGCRNCNLLESAVINALSELDVAADVEKVTDLNQIMEYDIMGTPGLVINDRVKVYGRIPRREEIIKWIKEEL